MIIEQWLNTYLRANVVARSYPMQLPHGVTLPAIRYQTIAKTPQYTHGGEDGLEPARIQISAFALTYTEAKTLSALARTKLSAYVGGMVSVIFCGPALDLIDTETATKIYHVTFDVTIWYEE